MPGKAKLLVKTLSYGLRPFLVSRPETYDPLKMPSSPERQLWKGPQVQLGSRDLSWKIHVPPIRLASVR